MANYRLSQKADADLSHIYEYGILNFGLTRAQSYLIGLHDRFENLANSPDFGRNSDQFGSELRRFEYRSHVIFYVPDDTGIFVVRVLGDSMDFKQHL